jgi:predicted peptidase
MNVLDIVRKDFTIDDNRIYLMGHSMGGGGTIHLGLKHPDLWAALAPIAPAIFNRPSDLEKINQMPIILVQGDADNLVRVAQVRPWADKMKELKMTYEYVEVPGGGHIDVAYKNLPKIFEFFDAHKKVPAKKE